MSTFSKEVAPRCQQTTSNNQQFLEKKHGIHNDTILAIGQFSVLWCWFEHDVFDTHLIPKDLKAWAKIYFYKKASDPQLKSLCESVRYSSKDYLGKIDEQLIRDRIYSPINQGKDDEHDAIHAFFEDNFSLDYFIGCLLYIHRIRNNLFHGLKGLHTLNCQKEIFDSINALLIYILR